MKIQFILFKMLTTSHLLLWFFIYADYIICILYSDKDTYSEKLGY